MRDDAQHVTAWNRSKYASKFPAMRRLKSLLFWVAYIPCGIFLILGALIGGVGRALSSLDNCVDASLHLFERWALEHPDGYYWFEDKKKPWAIGEPDPGPRNLSSD